MPYSWVGIKGVNSVALPAEKDKSNVGLVASTLTHLKRFVSFTFATIVVLGGAFQLSSVTGHGAYRSGTSIQSLPVTHITVSSEDLGSLGSEADSDEIAILPNNEVEILAETSVAFAPVESTTAFSILHLQPRSHSPPCIFAV